MSFRVGRLRNGQKLTVYFVSSGLLLSGLVWLVFFYFVRVTDQFGFESPHPIQSYFLIGHAVFALPSVWLFGFLWHIHVKPGWKSRLKRWSGGTIWSLVLWMILSGYALYYIGDDTVRDWVSLLHWTPGILALVIFLLHIRGTPLDSPESDNGAAEAG